MGASGRPGGADATARTLAALVGTLPPSALGGACLARFLPFAETTRATLGFASVLPLWVALMCIVFLAKTGVRAWALCALLGAALGALALGVPHG